MKNFHELSRDQKAKVKPVVDAIRKQLYGAGNNVPLLTKGMTINFGKNAEPRITVKVQIVG